MIGEPPVLTGRCHRTVNRFFPTVTLTAVGAVGRPVGLFETRGVDAVLEPPRGTVAALLPTPDLRITLAGPCDTGYEPRALDEKL